MKVGVSLNDVEVPKAVPQGQYNVKVVSCEVKDAKEYLNDPTQFVVFGLEITDDGDFKGKRLRDQATFKIDSAKDPDGSKTETALGFLKEKLEALKVKWDPDGFDTEDCINKKAIASVIVGEYQGRETNQVTRLIRVK